jgi:hypothetical protein
LQAPAKFTLRGHLLTHLTKLDFLPDFPQKTALESGIKFQVSFAFPHRVKICSMPDHP